MYELGKAEFQRQFLDQRITNKLQFLAPILAFILLLPACCLGYAWSSGSSIGSDGTIYGWAVTDGTPNPGYPMSHDAYVKSTPSSPKGRTASTGYGNYKWGVNMVRADLSLTFDATDLGTYTVQSFHRVHCIVMGWVLYDAPSSSSVISTMVSTQTVATSPTDRTRKKLGVGEQVTLTLQPTSVPQVSWTLTGNGRLSATTGNPVTFTAHDRASTSTVRANSPTAPNTVTFTVVEPTAVIIERELGTDIWHIQGTVSCGFRGRPYIQPGDVSFQYVWVIETEIAGVGTGYFSFYNGYVHPRWFNWIQVGSVIVGKGSMMNGIDQTSAGPFTATPYADGVFTWNIPWQFRVGTAGVGKQFAVVPERFVTDSTGKLTASKGGTIVTRYLNDPTPSY